jgi:signal transduction histidine kinase
VPLSVWQAPEFFDKHAHPDDLTMLQALFAKGPPQHMEVEYRLRHHAGHWVHVRSIASHEPAGGAMRGFFFDITEHHKLEQDLRQAQKLESVGRLASGVAHEINTPIQFVSDSLYFVRDACADLLKVLQQHAAVTRAIIAGETAGALAQTAAKGDDAADVSYIVEELPAAIDRALEGSRRVATIVRSMKVFAHPDSGEMQPVDLNENIESTLTIARSEYKYVADVVCELGALPPVVCFCSELNQVVLNLVTNAAHAIEEKVANTDSRGQITVRTRDEGDTVVIDIADTGGGIPPAVRDRVFDPFFTTKEVGRGTGQGLAIARSVVCDKHHGSLTFDTELGVGTIFHVRIPTQGKTAA